MIPHKMIALFVVGFAICASLPTTSASEPLGTSTGVSCVVDPSELAETSWPPPSVCMVGTVETTAWTECMYLESGNGPARWSCAPEYTLTFTIPAGHCAAARHGPDYESRVCAGEEADATFTMVTPGHTVASWEQDRIQVDLCLDTTSLDAPQCAHWTHFSGPAPYDPADPTKDVVSIGEFYDAVLYELFQQDRAPVGAGLA